MASRKRTARRSTRRDDALPLDVELDDIGDAFDDEDDLDALYGGGRASGGRARASLPHDWADFDYGDGLDADWR